MHWHIKLVLSERCYHKLDQDAITNLIKTLDTLVEPGSIQAVVANVHVDAYSLP